MKHSALTSLNWCVCIYLLHWKQNHRCASRVNNRPNTIVNYFFFSFSECSLLVFMAHESLKHIYKSLWIHLVDKQTVYNIFNLWYLCQKLYIEIYLEISCWKKNVSSNFSTFMVIVEPQKNKTCFIQNIVTDWPIFNTLQKACIKTITY